MRNAGSFVSLAAAVLVFFAAPRSSMGDVVLYDDFDDGNWDGWSVYNPYGEPGDTLTPVLVPSPEGWAVRGVGSGYGSPEAASLVHPLALSGVVELSIEMRARSGSSYPTHSTIALFSADEWIYNPQTGNYYALTGQDLSWSDAEAEAVAVGGHLVTINDEAENVWLLDTFGDEPSSQLRIGLYQLPGSGEPGGGWVWSSGQPVTYTNWSQWPYNEPNDSTGTDDWATMHTQSSTYGTPGAWNDNNNTGMFKGIIEREFSSIDWIGGYDYGEVPCASFHRVYNGQYSMPLCQSFTDPHGWHDFKWSRDAQGWWSLSIDGNVVAGNFLQDTTLTSFDAVALTVTRQESEIEWIYVSVPEPTNNPPIITCPPHITIECDESTDPSNTGEPTVTDDIDLPEDIAITYSDSMSAGCCPQESVITRTWTATDSGGLTDECVQMITVVDTTPPVIACPEDQIVECDGLGNAAELDSWLASTTASDNCGNVSLEDHFSGLSDECGATGSATVVWTATDVCGNVATGSATFTIEDTTPPTLIVDPTPITATDTDCSGDEVVVLPQATATDVCGDVVIENDAPPTFPAGQTTTVTYTATDECGNPTTDTLDVIVLYGSAVEVYAARHTIDSGPHPGSAKDPLPGIVVGAYDIAMGGCAREQDEEANGISWQEYEAIVANCEPVNTGVTDDYGMTVIDLPPGDYFLIAHIDSDGDGLLDEYLSVAANNLECGELMKKHLQLLVDCNGLRRPGKTTVLTGSELLIIEPEYVLWDDVDQLYPFVFESVGDWRVTATVAPPDGFVADYELLSEDVYYEVEAIQFTITEVGSDLVPTVTTFDVIHNGERRVVHSSVGIQLTPEYAQSRGFDVEELRACGLIMDKSSRKASPRRQDGR